MNTLLDLQTRFHTLNEILKFVSTHNVVLLASQR